MGPRGGEQLDESWPWDYLTESQVLTFTDAAERIQRISPNAPSPSDLAPSDVTATMLAMLSARFCYYAPLRTRRSEYHSDPVAMEYELPGVGSLRRVGADEHSEKICYQLTTPTGRHMAVLVRGYDDSLGMQVPQDPFVTVNDQGPEYRRLEYSEARTYFVAPITGSLAVELQEWGGENLESSRNPLYLGLATLARLRAQRRIDSIPGTHPRWAHVPKQELAHNRNLLVKPGRVMPLVIDVPFLQIIRGAEEVL